MFSVFQTDSVVSRRHFLGQCVAGLASLAGLTACGPREPLLRIASNIWPGYTLMRLAATRGYFAKNRVRLIEMPSATASLHSLAAGTLEGACLTMDELLTARAGGIPLSVVCVLDISRGADVLIARPDIEALPALKGRRIGVEQSAVGAVMLHAALRKAGLAIHDVEIVHTPFDRHYQAFHEHQVDALVTFQPIPLQLHGTPMVRLFSSADIAGGIVDVLAVRQEVLQHSPEALRLLIAGHFRARAEFFENPAAALPILAGELKLSPAQVTAAFSDIELLDVAANRQWLIDAPARLAQTAAEWAEEMHQAGLLPRVFPVNELADGRFLPQG